MAVANPVVKLHIAGMGWKVLVAPDKFKGTLAAQSAAECMERGWRKGRPQDATEVFPISDGGEGFGELTGACLRASPQTCRTVDAAHRPCEATWWWVEASRTAIIETARIIGLAMLEPGRYHPFELDTFGLGAVVQAAGMMGAKRLLFGIGGSATNDAGFGLARSLGGVFQNEHGQILERWTELHSLTLVHAPRNLPHFEEVVVAVDVQNPLLGPTGCARVYGPQKGLREQDFAFAERCLGRLATVIERDWHLGAANLPGAGAAGGLGFGLHCFLGATLKPGFALFADCTRLDEHLATANLVLTGEGSIDASTLMGKGAGELARACARRGIPCIGLAGVSDLPGNNPGCFTAVHAIVPSVAQKEEALARPVQHLETLAEQAALRWTDRHLEP
jgi:glycerate 2-kinase